MSQMGGGCTQAENTARNSDSRARIVLDVFAAASLVDAFREIDASFRQIYPDAAVVFNFAGSNQLAAQIKEGAPVDVFASADSAQMDNALNGGRFGTFVPLIFAYNRLVIVTPSDNPAALGDLPDLAKPGIKLVVAAAEVPAGSYALEFLNNTANFLGEEYKSAVAANIVSHETNVRAVLNKVVLGEADAGIVYTSDAAAQGRKVQKIVIPDPLNVLSSYQIAILADGAKSEHSQNFVDYVLGAQGQQVLVAHGFVAAAEGTSVRSVSSIVLPAIR